MRPSRPARPIATSANTLRFAVLLLGTFSSLPLLAQSQEWQLPQRTSQTPEQDADPRVTRRPKPLTGPVPEPKLAVPDSFAIEAHSSTYMMLFQRAFLPGPAGAIATPVTSVPTYEYLMLRVVDIDAPWSKNSIDGELSLWGSAILTGADGQRVMAGDVSVANVSYRAETTYLKLGRQYVTEGAARFSHLDGTYVSYRAKNGFALSGYGGFTVLPQWNNRPNYALLGSASDAMVSRPEDFPRATRGGNWMAGGRVGYSYPKVGELGLSLHEQRENSALGRRDAAVDLHLPGSDFIDGSARALVDLDSGGLADAFLGAALHPMRPLDIAIDYRRMTPTLLMSRQSVLSVFAVDRFDELGGEARYQLFRSVQVFAGGFVEWFENSGHGTRIRSGFRISPDAEHRILVNGSYTRVTEPENGYHGTRLSVGYRLAQPVMVTAEQYLYLYDHAIRNVTTSTVHAVTASYRPSRPFEILLGGTLFNSPYAAMDAQAMLRLSYTYGAALGGEP